MGFFFVLILYPVYKDWHWICLKCYLCFNQAGLNVCNKICVVSHRAVGNGIANYHYFLKIYPIISRNMIGRKDFPQQKAAYKYEVKRDGSMVWFLLLQIKIRRRKQFPNVAFANLMLTWMENIHFSNIAGDSWLDFDLKFDLAIPKH